MLGLSQVFVACAPGLEGLLAQEVTQVLGRAPKLTPGGVELEADLEAVVRLNLELGVATHVLVRINKFPARHFSQLDKSLQKIDWGAWFRPGAPLAVRVKSHRSKLYHSKGIEQRIRESVQSVLRMPSPDAEGEDGARLMVRLDHDLCTLSVDSSGAPLHRRGYRLASAKAPLREDLARAVVKLSGWTPGATFADPFCGSGTLGIEAALLARGLPPGGRRKFAFEDWPGFDEAVLTRLRQRAREGALDGSAAPIWLSDRDAGAVVAASENAARAGVEADLHIAEAPMGRAPFLVDPPQLGFWVSNPPHGGRIGQKDRLRNLHQSLGRRFEALPPGWGLALVVRDRRLAYSTGLTLETRVMTEHGGSKIWVLGTVLEKVT